MANVTVESPAKLSSRMQTRATGVFTRETPGSRSLERGLLIFRAFRPTDNALTNADLADRTGLPRSTVSRLTRSLVDCGFLEFDIATSTYRLGPPFLTFGQNVRQGSSVLQTALPLMRELADGLKINVGLAVADAGEMVYLDSVRKSRLGIFRHVASGSRLAIAESALGRAWLHGIGAASRERVLELLAARYGPAWPVHFRAVRQSLIHIERHGYCALTWTSGLVSIASPLVVPGHAVHAFNISYPSWGEAPAALEARYAPLLLGTLAKLRDSLTAQRQQFRAVELSAIQSAAC